MQSGLPDSRKTKTREICPHVFHGDLSLRVSHGRQRMQSGLPPFPPSLHRGSDPHPPKFSQPESCYIAFLQGPHEIPCIRRPKIRLIVKTYLGFFDVLGHGLSCGVNGSLREIPDDNS